MCLQTAVQTAVPPEAAVTVDPLSCADGVTVSQDTAAVRETVMPALGIEAYGNQFRQVTLQNELLRSHVTPPCSESIGGQA